MVERQKFLRVLPDRVPLDLDSVCGIALEKRNALSHGKGKNQRTLLVHDANAKIVRLLWGNDVPDCLAVNGDLRAAVSVRVIDAGQDLDERRLAAAVGSQNRMRC